jgi:hypothetical protein
MDKETTDMINKEYSEERKNTLIKHFQSFYGESEEGKKSANSFAMGFSKAWDIIISELIKK